MENLARRTWEFYDEIMIVKIKSLTIDFETEIKYEKIKAIRSKKTADLNWAWATFVIIGVLGMAKFIFHYFGLNSSAIPFVEKAVIIFGLILLAPAFRKYEFYSFFDADKNSLATVKIDGNNQKAIREVINLIKQKTEIISEIYPSDSLPSTLPVFENVEFDFPDFLSKSTARFYDDRIIYIEKSLVGEVTAEIKYGDFSGKTQIIKMGNKNWDYAWSYWLMFVCITSTSLIVFFPQQMIANLLYPRLFLGGLILIIPMFFLRYVKNEFLVFYNRNGDVFFWIQRNPKNNKKLDQIVEFIQEKVSVQHKTRLTPLAADVLPRSV